MCVCLPGYRHACLYTEVRKGPRIPPKPDLGMFVSHPIGAGTECRVSAPATSILTTEPSLQPHWRPLAANVSILLLVWKVLEPVAPPCDLSLRRSSCLALSPSKSFFPGTNTHYTWPHWWPCVCICLHACTPSPPDAPGCTSFPLSLPQSVLTLVPGASASSTQPSAPASRLTPILITLSSPLFSTSSLFQPGSQSSLSRIYHFPLLI